MVGYAPKYGGMDHAGGALQFPASRLTGLSFRVTPIEYVGKDNAHATGFFWVWNGKQYLITNWHAITLVDPFSGECLTDKNDFYTPKVIRVFATRWLKPDVDNGFVVPERVAVEIPLFNGDEPLWRQHPNFETERVDLIALELPSGYLECRNGGNPGFNGHSYEKLFNLVGADVFAIGYPFKSYDGAMSALWKRGSLASEPLLCVDRKPLFLIDILGTSGMSGSPVVRRVFGPAIDADLSTRFNSVCCDEFIGVYAGRLRSDELDRVGLGYAWHGRLVQELVEHGVKGTTN